MNENEPRIFLCHASDDKARVRELYHQLKEAGYHPWLDEENLPPGQNWRIEIRRVIRDSNNLVVVCLSNNSITKQGTVQREIKWALDVLEEMPEDTIYLIPARLEDCRPPDQLSDLHWVDLFEPSGFERLTRALDFEIGERQAPSEPEMVTPTTDHLPLEPEVIKAPVEVEKVVPEPDLELHPSLSLKLSVKPQTVGVGDEATWTVTLRNDGDEILRHVSVTHGRTLLDEPFELAVGKGRRFTFTTTYKSEGKKSEKVTATGIASNGRSARDEASTTVQVRKPQAVTPSAEPAPRRKAPAKTAPDVLTITSPIKLELILIPAGEFLMGSDPSKDTHAWDDEQPQHRGDQRPIPGFCRGYRS
jgi:hypothetical protein